MATRTRWAVSMAAHMIENRLLTASTRRQTRLHLHASPGALARWPKALWCCRTTAGSSAPTATPWRCWGCVHQDLSARQLSDVIAAPYGQLLARNHRRPGQPMPLHLHGGALVYGVLQTPQTVELRSTATGRCSACRCFQSPRQWRHPLAQRCRQGAPRAEQADPVLIRGRVGRGQGVVCARPTRC